MNYPKTTADLASLVGKVILFNRLVETTELDYDTGMKTRVVGYQDKGDGCFMLQTDFSEFQQYNEGLMKSNYYDKNGQPTLKWSETAYYRPTETHRDWFDWSVEVFKVVDG